MMIEMNEWCKFDNVFEYFFLKFFFIEINKFYDLIRVESGKFLLVDIRDVFWCFENSYLWVKYDD